MTDLATPVHDADIASHTSPARARLELLLVGTAAFAVSLSMSLLVPVMPLLSGPNGLIPSHPSQDAAQWLLTSMLMAGAVSVPLFGRLGDMFGKRRMLIIATSLLVVGSVISGMTSNLPLMIAGRALQGMSMPAIPLGISLLASLLPRERVGSAVALISAMLGVGSALALPIGGLVGEHTDYHWLFWITAVGGAVGVIGIWLVLPEAPDRSPGRIDLLGSVLLTAALVTLLLPLAESASWGWGSARTIVLLVVSALLFAVLGLVESRTAVPLIDLAALSRKPIVLTNIAAVLLGFAMFAMMIGTASYVQAPKALTGYGFDASLVVSGFCLLPAGGMMLLLSSSAARLIHRIGAPKTLAFGAVVLAVGWLVRLTLHGHLWEIIVGTAIIGVGIAFGFAALPTLINTHTPVAELAAANGLNALARYIGTSLASAVGGSILAGHLIDGTALPTFGAFRVIFIACCVAAVAAAVVALQVPRHPDVDAMPEL
ncbi:MFS transporter [Nocardioides sp. Kera G14]|uniref:MFS transporter n=1 Tax=Nocardioides sp. Kera G14 TaxID=2884264 RepID=UPI001D0F9149|nr:MFS transporter [Nocardioides sp. Kera G14]UDY22899.1 MFS transporter [Nocardioides sp. Kera G14]